MIDGDQIDQKFGWVGVGGAVVAEGGEVSERCLASWPMVDDNPTGTEQQHIIEHLPDRRARLVERRHRWYCALRREPPQQTHDVLRLGCVEASGGFIRQ